MSLNSVGRTVATNSLGLFAKAIVDAGVVKGTKAGNNGWWWDNADTENCLLLKARTHMDMGDWRKALPYLTMLAARQHNKEVEAGEPECKS